MLKSDALNKDREVLGTEVGIVDAMRFQGVALHHSLVLQLAESLVSRQLKPVCACRCPARGHQLQVRRAEAL